jgi:transposase
VQALAGFIVEKIQLLGSDNNPRIEIHLASDPRRKPRCPECGRRCPGYDRQRERRWQFVPLWNIPVWLRYRPRRVQCPVHGVLTEAMPWNEGKRPYARDYMLFLARWARRLSWKETAQIFRCSWEAVRRSVDWVVAYGLENRSLEGVTALGVDELHYGRGKKSDNFVTVVYQIDRGMRRLLWLGRKRTQKTLRDGFAELEKQRQGFLSGLKVICSDMWKPYLKVIAQKAGAALNVLDPFHVAKHLNAAVDEVRRGEQSRIRRGDAKAQAKVKRGRFLLLKRASKVRGRARAKLKLILGVLRRTSRAWELKESFRHFWKYSTPDWAGAFLKQWITRALRSRIEPMRRVALMLRRHEDLLLNYFRARRMFTSAMVEGMNNKARVSLARGYGYRSFNVLKLVLYHTLGSLPEPPSTHKF